MECIQWVKKLYMKSILLMQDLLVNKILVTTMKKAMKMKFWLMMMKLRKKKKYKLKHFQRAIIKTMILNKFETDIEFYILISLINQKILLKE